MIIVYTTKPFMSRRMLPCLLAQYPTQKIVFIHSLYFTNVMLDYPKDIKWTQFPYIQEAEFKINTIDKWLATTPENGALVPVDVSMDDIKHCEKIIYMDDPSYHDVYYFSVFFEKVFEESIENRHIDAVYLVSLAIKDIQNAWDKKGNFFDMFKDTINYGHVVRYFDYNFNFNSFALFGKVYRHIDKKFNPESYVQKNDFGNIFFSKYMVQLLYFVREQELNGINFTEDNLINQMYQWRGTGKYVNKTINSPASEKRVSWRGAGVDSRARLGGITSRTSIIKNLISLNLLKIAQVESKSHIFITEKGRSFLQAIPKDCMDYDLPFRIKIWAEQPFETSKEKIDSYVNNYYKKIKHRVKTLQD